MVSLDTLKQHFNGKHVFLTGHTGFKGAWLLQILNLAGAKVKGYALEPETSKDLYSTINGDKLCDSVIADIRDFKTLYNEIIAFQPDFIFHLAAQPLVRKSYEKPLYTWEVNVNGTAHVLEVCKSLEKKCAVICITTDKVYENNEKGIPFLESDPLGGYDPYSASKAGAELVIATYRNSFFGPESPINVASARAGNVIGGGDFAADRIVPDFVRAHMGNAHMNVRRPDAIRPWQHVLEPLAGYLKLAIELYNDKKFAQAYNFGPHTNDVLTVKELIEEASNIWPGVNVEFAQVPEGVHEAGVLMLNIDKAMNELNFKPVWTAKESIKQTIDWYKDSLTPEITKCKTQILNYFK